MIARMLGIETFLKEDVTMERTYVFLFVTVFMLLSGCASVPTKDIQVDAQADPKASFTGHRTYAWLGSAKDAFKFWAGRIRTFFDNVRHVKN